MLMVSSLRHAGLAGLVVACVGQPALAQAPVAPAGSPPSPAKAAEEQLLLRLPAGQSLDRYLEQLRGEFFNLDADGDGKLTQRDVELHAAMEAVQVRSVAWMSVLRYDLDGDGFVTEDEVRRSAAYESRWARAQSVIGKSPLGGSAESTERMVTTIMALDVNKDGKVSLAEAAKFNEANQRVASLSGYAAKTRLALALETATAGELSRAAYEATGEALFRKVDTDSDGKVSQQELMEFRRTPAPPSSDPDVAQKRQHEQAELARKRQRAIDAERAVCAMPAVSEKARVVLLSAYQTESLSSVTIGSQDAVVHAGRINVEPGSDPLYVVIASFSPTIWQFGGAVERIERVVVTSLSTGGKRGDPTQGPLTGATGVARDRVSFLGRANCLTYFHELPSSGSLQAVGAVRDATGRAPDVVAAKYAVSTFNVPSGGIDTLKGQSGQGLVIRKSGGTLNIVGNPGNVVIETGPSRAHDDLQRYWPGGVVDIDPASVVASGPVTPYEVLPAQAGLVQLLANGSVTQNGAGEFVVRKKIRFPSGLHGAHSVTFLVVKGTPYPDGDPGHSCVMVEDTGEKSAGCPSR
ncbi:Ca2+-binding EF-hand superfamily protein [Bradyrhizobium sp. USDA 4524]